MRKRVVQKASDLRLDEIVHKDFEAFAILSLAGDNNRTVLLCQFYVMMSAAIGTLQSVTLRLNL